MKRLVLSLSVVVAVLGLAVAGCCCLGGNRKGGEAASTGQGGHAGEGAVAAQANCPVMGGPIDKDIYADHEGRRVYFCCAGCIAAFNEDPEKYIAKLDAELAP